MVNYVRVRFCSKFEWRFEAESQKTMEGNLEKSESIVGRGHDDQCLGFTLIMN